MIFRVSFLRKKYSYSLNVGLANPNFAMYLYDYNTRDNYFLIKVKNYSTLPLRIHSNDAKVCEDNYKSYDRNVYISGGDVIVKPKKKAKIRFYVDGSITWYNEDDFWMEYYFTFDGVKYIGKARSTVSFSKYKKTNNKYYTTYWKDVTPDYWS